MAVTNANLIVSFKPASVLPEIGKITITVPAWYILRSTFEPFLYSSETMLSFESEPEFQMAPALNPQITSYSFDASSRTLKLTYSGKRAIRSDEEVII